MPSPILVIWVLLSILVAGTCTFSFLQPFWFLHEHFTHSFGIISFCFGDTRLFYVHEVCGSYGGNFNLGSIPSGAWQAACVLYGGGCGLLSLGALLATCVVCIPLDFRKRTTRLAGYTQSISGNKLTRDKIWKLQVLKIILKYRLYIIMNNYRHNVIKRRFLDLTTQLQVIQYLTMVMSSAKITTINTVLYELTP